LLQLAISDIKGYECHSKKYISNGCFILAIDFPTFFYAQNLRLAGSNTKKMWIRFGDVYAFLGTDAFSTILQGGLPQVPGLLINRQNSKTLSRKRTSLASLSKRIASYHDLIM
jgi:hypothetical protein